jgi:hypothetical protein
VEEKKGAKKIASATTTLPQMKNNIAYVKNSFKPKNGTEMPIPIAVTRIAIVIYCNKSAMYVENQYVVGRSPELLINSRKRL